MFWGNCYCQVIWAGSCYTSGMGIEGGFMLIKVFEEVVIDYYNYGIRFGFIKN
jgi:hypothetical protein